MQSVVYINAKKVPQPNEKEFQLDDKVKTSEKEEKKSECTLTDPAARRILSLPPGWL